MALTFHSDINICSDCRMLIANGEGPDETAERLAKKWPHNETVIDIGDGESFFSGWPCQGCGDTMAGDRFSAKAYEIEADRPKEPRPMPKGDAIRTMRWLVNGTTYRLRLWDAGRQNHQGKDMLRYELTSKRLGERRQVIFQGADFGCSPLDLIDSRRTALAVMDFLTLRKGDTDADYFEGYTEAQLAFRDSFDCEHLQGEVGIAEERIAHRERIEARYEERGHLIED